MVSSQRYIAFRKMIAGTCFVLIGAVILTAHVEAKMTGHRVEITSERILRPESYGAKHA